MTTTFSPSFADLSINCADPAVLADVSGKTLRRPVSPQAMPYEVTEPEMVKSRVTVLNGPSYLQGGS